MRINVLIPGYRQVVLTYSTNEIVFIGQVVFVTIRGKICLGVIWELDCESDLKNILEIHEVTKYSLSEDYLKCLKKASEYNLITCSSVLEMGLCAISLEGEYPFYCLYENKIYSTSYLIQSLGKVRFLKLLPTLQATSFNYEFKFNPYETQKQAWAQIKTLGFEKPLVIQGRTGSGKTSLYFQIIHEHLEMGKQVLILMPEISLTKTFANRVLEEFNFMPHVWNSSVSLSVKNLIWKWAQSDEPGIVIGSRSSVWIPFKKLGCIIVDEEHDQSYKQDNYPRYQARDMSILRKKYEKVCIGLVSATPSLETWFNIKQGKYNLVYLEGNQPIQAKIIKRKPGHWLSQELKDSIDTELSQGKQCMLFLNRKGIALSVFCGVCDEYVMCDHCSANLILYPNFVVGCAYCGKKKYLEQCKNCGDMSWKTYGIGLDKIEEEAQQIFPNASIGKFTGDIKQLSKSIEDIYSGKINLILSTQILAKGYNFLNLSLVGIIQGDQGINHSNPRNFERMYQLLTQVRGRCGRSQNLSSKVFIQANNPKNEVLKHILENDYAVWADSELEFRKTNQLPPVYKLIRFTVSSSNANNAATDAKFLYNTMLKLKNCTIFPPVQNDLYKYKSKFHYSIILRYHYTVYPQIQLQTMSFNLPNKSNWYADVDPY